MEVRCLGPMRVTVAGREVALGGPKQRLVLAHLLLEPGRVVSTEHLIDAVWGADAPTAARNTIQTYVSNLRKALGAERLEGRGRGYALLVSTDELDTARFESLAAEGRGLIGRDPEAAAELLASALSLWSGPPFGDLAGASSLAGEVTRLEELRLAALGARIEADLLCGLHGEVVGELESLTAAHPLREHLWELLMLALYRCGRQADALDAFQRVRALMADQVGIDPTASLRQLQRRILAQDPALEPPDGIRRRQVAAGSSESTSTADDPAVPFPALLAGERGVRYVGRRRLLDDLRSRWQDALSGQGGRGVLLTGEPGVGKTRTATELAREAADGGALVLAGRCDEQLAVPYQPFAEALDWQTQHDPSLSLGRLPGELVRLLPELTQRVPGLPPPVASDPRVEEHRLLEAVTSWVVEVSAERPLLLVLEDLHWASTETLRMVGHLLRTVPGHADVAVLLVATYRDTEIPVADGLAGLLGEVSRLSGVERFEVADLPEDEVLALVAEVAGLEVDATARRLARLAYDAARGNPFLVGEVLRHLIDLGVARFADGRWQVAEPSLPSVPDGVRDVVSHRVRRLPTAAHELLWAAAVIGREADVASLARVVTGGIDQVLDGVDVALRAGLVEEHAPERFRFTHELVRAALLHELSGPRRRRLHAAILDAIEVLHPQDVVRLAHHAVQAGPAARSPGRAVRYTVTAGEQALQRRAVADALGWFVKACALVDTADELECSWGLRARCGLGEAQRDVGDQAYRATLLGAARDAMAAGELGLALRAAIANHRPTTVSAVGVVDREKVAVLEQLQERLEPATPGDVDMVVARAQILTLLSLELTFDPAQVDRRLRLADEALALAQGTGGAWLAAWVLATIRIPITVAARGQQLPGLMRQATTHADTSGDPLLRCAARVSAHQALLGVGRIAEARASAEAAVDLADAEGAPFVQLLARFNAVQYRAYDGDLTGAREENLGCLGYGQDLGEPDAAMWWGAIEGLLAVLDGTVARLADAFAAFADGAPGVPAWRAAHVMSLTLGGRHEEARELVTRHGLDHPERLPDDWIRLSALAHLAVVAFELDDVELGTSLAEMAAPHRQLWTHVNVFCQGPVELTLGLALAAAGRRHDAVAALRTGWELLRSRGLRSHLPWASLYLARVLASGGEGNEAEAVRQLATDGAAAAQAMGMATMAEKLEGLIAPVTPRAGSSPAT
jgi:DNA-binding SARP family transcriptional activator